VLFFPGDLRKEIARLSQGYQQLMGQLGVGGGIALEGTTAGIKPTKSKKLSKGRPGSALQRFPTASAQAPLEAAADSPDSPVLGGMSKSRNESFEVRKYVLFYVDIQPTSLE
jgi:hypothetical protein